MSGDILQRLAAFVANALMPLASALAADDDVLALVEELGWTLPAVPPSITGLGASAEAVIDALADAELAAAALEDGDGDDDDAARSLAKLVVALGAFLLQVRQLRARLAAELPAPFVAATGIAEALPKRLLEDLMVRAIAARSPLLAAVASLAGLVEEAEVEADPARFQPDFTRRTIRLDRVEPLFTDTGALLQDIYGWGTPDLDLERLFVGLQRLSYPLLAPIEVRYPDDALLAATAPGEPISEDEGPPPLYTLPLHEGGPITIVLALMPLPKATPGELQGIAVTLTFDLEAEASLDIGPRLTLTGDGALDLASGVAAVLRPDRDPAIILGLSGGGALPAGKGGARLLLGDADEQAMRLFTIPGGSFLEFRTVHLALGVDASSGSPDIYVEAGMTGGALKIAPSGDDSFLAAILPADGVTVPLEFGVEWSSRLGLRFHGGGHLDIAIPLDLRLGPFWVSSAYVDLAAADGGIILELSVDGGAAIGPVEVSIARMGVKLDLALREGNLGLVDLNAGFLPPRAVGVSIEAGGFSGGGFLYVDPDAGGYSGALELRFLDKIHVKAVGVLDTRLPEGGYSLLLAISAEFSPIQLGFGLTLNGVGGLIGVNRTVLAAQLGLAIADGSLDSILFPKNLIGNAPAIIKDLKRHFPPAAGRHLFGPMAKLGWGTPALASLDLGLVLDIPSYQIIIIGVLRVVAPPGEEALLNLQVNFVGNIDFDKKQFSLDATLFQSRFVTFTLTGDMAVRVYWGADNANILATVGGFHPAYEPPPMALPALKRLSIIIFEGNPRLTAQAYFAVTSNTCQFGARVELHYGLSLFSVSGFLSVDALLQFVPFRFLAAVSGAVAVRAGGTLLFSIRLELTLEGPGPWRARGRGSFEIGFIFTITVSAAFDVTFGDALTQLPRLISIAPLIEAALRESGNWIAPSSLSRRVTVRELPESAGTIMPPMGAFAVLQKVAPLNIPVQRLGPARVEGASRFSIVDVKLGGVRQDVQPRAELFAPAEFLDLSDDEKLARRSFEPFEAGVEMLGLGVRADLQRHVDVSYEVIYVRKPRRRLLLTLQDGLMDILMNQSAAARSKASPTPRAPTGLGTSRVALSGDGFVIAGVADLKRFAPDLVFTSETAAVLAMREIVANDSRLAGRFQVVGAHEAAA